MSEENENRKSKITPTKLSVGEFNSNKEMLVGLIGAGIVIALILFFILVVIYAGISFYGVLPSSIKFLIDSCVVVFVIMIIVGFFVNL